MLCWQHRCINGRVDISVSLSLHGAVQRSERECVHSYANGVDKMHIPWAVEGLPTLLHLSLFLFFGGLVIFLFNIDQEVFICVVCVDRAFLNGVWIDHTAAINSAG